MKVAVRLCIGFWMIAGLLTPCPAQDDSAADAQPRAKVAAEAEADKQAEDEAGEKEAEKKTSPPAIEAAKVERLRIDVELNGVFKSTWPAS
jgi:hypothetical protein